MIDIRKLKELVRLMVENDLSELDLRDQQETVTIKRGGQPVIHAPGVPIYAAAPAAGAEAPESFERPEASDAGLPAIESPMVGTFYQSSSPDAAPFVQVGSPVGPDTTVCLIEAMKVFNEIKAERAGVIERILVDNGQAVEFGQKLFLIRPA